MPDDDAFEDPRDDPDRPPHPGAAAVNWKTLLVVDGLIGLAVGVAGVYLLVRGALIAGALLAAFGGFYVTRVSRRASTWMAYRRHMGWR